MGNGASVKGDDTTKEHHEKLQQAVKEETDKPLDGTDVDTPRGETAKEEVKRLRKKIADLAKESKIMEQALLGDVPSLMEYFEHVFKRWDEDGNGTISAKELWDNIAKLKLDVTPEELHELQAITDVDKDGVISLEEFTKAAPKYFQTLAEKSSSKERDWMVLETEDGHPYFYNKRTQESSWEAPAEYLASVNEVAQEEEAKMAPDMKEYLTRAFKDADKDASGELSIEEFWALLQDQLGLGLNEERLSQLQAKSDVDQDGSVRWQEFVLVGPSLIQEVYQSSHEDECWYELSDPEHGTYYINSKTGASQWEKPAALDGTAAAADTNTTTQEEEQQQEDQEKGTEPVESSE